MAQNLPVGHYTLSINSMDKFYSYDISIRSGLTNDVFINIPNNSLTQKQISIPYSQVNPEKGEEAVLIDIIEDMPKFNGDGDLEEFRKFIQKQVKHPSETKSNNIKGTVYANFVVNEKGEVDQIKVIRGVSPELDKEVVQALKKSPKWTPAIRRGKPVAVSMAIPVKFE